MRDKPEIYVKSETCVKESPNRHTRTEAYAMDPGVTHSMLWFVALQIDVLATFGLLTEKSFARCGPKKMATQI